MVTSQKIRNIYSRYKSVVFVVTSITRVTIIGNRGSKSIAARLCGREFLDYKSAIVKEQRINGSYHLIGLKYILTGLEINYQNRILSK